MHPGSLSARSTSSGFIRARPHPSAGDCCGNKQQRTESGRHAQSRSSRPGHG
jgi:hypothetical protein